MRSKPTASSGLIWLRQSRTPRVGGWSRRWWCGFCGDVHGAGVLEHRGLERKRGEVADGADDALGVGDEILVANLEIARLRPPCARGPARGEPPSATRRRSRRRSRGCAHVFVTTPAGMSRNASAASRPSRMRCTYCASGKRRSMSARCRMYMRRLVSPARLAVLGGIRREGRRDGLAHAHAGAKPSGEVVRGHLPRGEPRQPAKVVEEARDVDRARMPVRELRNEERLVGDGDPGRAVEDDPQQRRARPADAEDEQWGCGHGRRTTTTEPGRSDCQPSRRGRSGLECRCVEANRSPRQSTPDDARSAAQEPVDARSVRLDAHHELLAGHSNHLRLLETDVAQRHDCRGNPLREVPREVTGLNGEPVPSRAAASRHPAPRQPTGARRPVAVTG